MPFNFAPVGQDDKQASAAKVLFNLSSSNFTAAVTEAMVTVIPSKDGVNLSSVTSYIVTSAKRLVLLSFSVATRNAGAAGQGVICKLRYNPVGAVVATSPIIGMVGAGTFLAIANIIGFGSTMLSGAWPTQFEIAGDGTKQIGISQIGTATAGNEVVLTGYEY